MTFQHYFSYWRSETLSFGVPEFPQGLPYFFARLQAKVLHEVRFANVGTDGSKQVHKRLENQENWLIAQKLQAQLGIKRVQP